MNHQLSVHRWLGLEEKEAESYLDNALLEHDETVVCPPGHQEEESRLYYLYR